MRSHKKGSITLYHNWLRKETARYFGTDVFQKLSRLICPDFTRNSLTKQSVVQEIPHLLWNPNIYHVHKTRRRPRLFVTLRNTHTKRFVGLSPPNMRIVTCGMFKAALFSIFKINLPGMCSISVTLECVGTNIFIYGIQWRRRLTKLHHSQKTPAIQGQSRSNGR